MQRGFQRVQAADGSYPYEQFQIDSTESVFLTLTQLVDGVEVPLDVSSGSTTVKLRAKMQDVAAFPVNVTMTKRTGTTTAGDTGKVSCDVVLRAADFTILGGTGEMGVYILNTGSADAATPSGSKETLWNGLWEFTVLGQIDVA